MNRAKITAVFSVFAASVFGLLIGGSINAQSDSPNCIEGKCPSEEYDGFYEASPWGRYTATISKSQRFTTKPLDMKRIAYLCGDMDGCTVRLGMYNWDGQMRIASRTSMFYYNKDTRRWRSEALNPDVAAGSAPDFEGEDFNGTTNHVAQAWSCYVTDGEYNNRAESDSKRGLGLLSWDTFGYNADCWVTFVD
jgi:hypothetical protein